MANSSRSRPARSTTAPSKTRTGSKRRGFSTTLSPELAKSSSKSFKVQLATPGSYEGVVKLLEALDEFHRERVPWLFRKTSEPARSLEEYATLIEGPDTTLLTAIAPEAAGPEVIGVAIVMIKSTPAFPVFVPAQFGVIDNLVVDERYRRAGVGKALTRAAEDWARSRGARWLELGVYEFNEGARDFYQALGYSTVTRKLQRPLT